MINVELFEPDDFGKLKDVWECLASGPDMTAFQSYDWYRGLNEQYKTGAFRKSDTVVYVLASRDGIPVLIAPLYIKKRGFAYKGIGIPKGIYIFGMWGFTDYLNFIYTDFCGDCFQQIAEITANRYSVDTFRLYQLINGSGMDCFLKAKYPGSICHTNVCVSISYQGSFEEYARSLSKNIRQNIRTAKNRAEKEGLAITCKIPERIDGKTANELFRIYLQRSDRLNKIDIHRGLKQTLFALLNRQYNRQLKKRLGHYNYITETMQRGKQNYIAILYAADKIAGYLYGLRTGASDVLVMIVAYREEYKAISPGILGLYSCLEIMGSKGEKVTVDLTRGTEKYKYDLGGTEHMLNSYMCKLRLNEYRESQK